MSIINRYKQLTRYKTNLMSILILCCHWTTEVMFSDIEQAVTRYIFS